MLNQNPNRNPKTRKIMAHITIEYLGNELYKLVPESGWVLYNKVSRTRHSEAVVKEERIKDFVAVEA